MLFAPSINGTTCMCYTRVGKFLSYKCMTSYLHISGVFLHIADGDALIAMDGNSPSLMDITFAMVAWITPLQLVRVTR